MKTGKGEAIEDSQNHHGNNDFELGFSQEVIQQNIGQRQGDHGSGIPRQDRGRDLYKALAMKNKSDDIRSDN